MAHLYLRTIVGLIVGSSILQAQKPDLRAGGASPSKIPNHATTKVTLPGYHLSGAQITVDGACTLISSTISDTQVVMSIAGNRQLSDRDGYCNLNVKNAAGADHTWIIVGLTEEEEKQIKANDREANRQKFQAFLAKSGTRWTLSFAGGGSITYTLKPSDDDGLATFADSSGREVKIAVSNDNAVTIMSDQCFRMGTLSSGHVRDGKSSGTCIPSGAWTATMQ